MEPNETVEEYKKKKEQKNLKIVEVICAAAAMIIFLGAVLMLSISKETIGVLKAIFFVIISGIFWIVSILSSIRNELISAKK